MEAFRSFHAHYLGKEMELTATLPDSKVIDLLRIDDFDFSWQEQYLYDGSSVCPRERVSTPAYAGQLDRQPRNPEPAGPR